jgi:hypothetical protein
LIAVHAFIYFLLWCRKKISQRHLPFSDSHLCVVSLNVHACTSPAAIKGEVARIVIGNLSKINKPALRVVCPRHKWSRAAIPIWAEERFAKGWQNFTNKTAGKKEEKIGLHTGSM